MLFWKFGFVFGLHFGVQVSILILLDVVLEVFNKMRISGRYWVSILILLDVVLEAIVGCNNFQQLHQFQSLFCWMLFWKSFLMLSFFTVFGVSILILLDVVLEEMKSPTPSESGTSFNPYSVGCCSGSTRVWHWPPPMY